MSKKRNDEDKLRANTAEKIAASQLVAIIRLPHQSEVTNVVQCLVIGGVSTLEITSNTPGFATEITSAREKHPNVLIGAGTIINSTLAKEAIKAGAQFLVTPNTEKSVIKTAHKHGIPVLMGALTPTDIANCIKYKADFIKVFPAGSLGLTYFKGLQGPFSNTHLMPVGGVNINNIEEWFEAGAIGVGVGNDLTRAANTVAEQKTLIELVKKYVSKLPKNK
ncbi:bifunctional 4-hydroxy-2-oxoglutarate aldolase/2-dehydro-3-deoxy-phosphogluconate aldolase [Aliiglaciecola sp. 3_MG-2023]|uniref:bifunctional 4-hydroxy-2-oxoglutarate aldolase/2-dehydro-3-deoxy-phosphogluconate aldolase n=1 Tax=Aliiglaciecola sp. 3_MG-2023 TaxID=3062644 RepID=UPI0026E1A0B8|nr:bifunctional 4-hydroxy-2-oxoglutarate aldolase/2-dehydro-3-deoxy-phosphogluconate aldolase [Aliiglaciecola sp. 3_MG-2023]MDO6693889.1 bifunctional 4-hydroxy-2-oxoglutarate aldolase/2-dehydro-3-deoxy-phosphogluconate aldolase [Aliiglaciecola sp. 3_MG-2023]